MDGNEDAVRERIVKLLENAFIVRRAIDPEQVAIQLAPSVNLPVAELTNQITAVAKLLGVKVMLRQVSGQR
jgi:hypothetical protein